KCEKAGLTWSGHASVLSPAVCRTGARKTPREFVARCPDTPHKQSTANAITYCALDHKGNAWGGTCNPSPMQTPPAGPSVRAMPCSLTLPGYAAWQSHEDACF